MVLGLDEYLDKLTQIDLLGFLRVKIQVTEISRMQSESPNFKGTFRFYKLILTENNNEYSLM